MKSSIPNNQLKGAALAPKEKPSFFSITKAFQHNVLTDAMITLGNSFELPALFRRLGWRQVSSIFIGRKVKYTSRLAFLGHFAVHLLRLKRHHGAVYVVLYLKACQLAVQKCIAGTPMTSLKESMGDFPVKRLDRRGLPRVIPVQDRSKIAAGSSSIIRFWLTLFSIYRIIKIPGLLKLETITDPLSVPQWQVDEIGKKLGVIASRLHKSFAKIDVDSDLLLIEKASPTHGSSWTGLWWDTRVLRDLGLSSSLEELIQALGLKRLANSYAIFCVAKDMQDERVPDSFCAFVKAGKDSAFKPSRIAGQLSIKEEAAGKLRVFALVDIWTQSILKPIHDSLFYFLKSLPNDSTFNQRAAVKRCFTKAQAAGGSWGFDLSAATDRLPLAIQIPIVSSIFGEKVGPAWAKLLTDREYTLDQFGDNPTTLKYEVGQPMGALSSWAMLAVTHHFIVQLAYQSVNLYKIRDYRWFDNYELLGDDIVIFDKEVADAYLKIMSDLGVGINLQKSVIAVTNAFEFAKVTGLDGLDVSALSWRALISQNTMMGRVNLFYALLERGYNTKHWVSWLTRVTRMKKSQKGDITFTLLALWSMFASSGKVSFVNVFQSLYNLKDPAMKFYKVILLNANLDFIKTSIGRILTGQEPPRHISPAFERMWRVEGAWLTIALVKPLFVHTANSRIGKEKDPDLLAGGLAWQVMVAAEPSLETFGYLSTTDFGSDWTEYEQVINANWLALRTCFLNKFIRLGSNLGPQDYMRLDIDQLLERLADLDRIEELRTILDRAKAKKGGEAKVVKRLDSPLKSINILLKNRKLRPAWTYKSSSY